ncbi:hypothetical protein [Pseudoduganella namucuonensis]|uniref:Uncharacterized protein n=1 Tax=Pseudoduganella namucuonensis TaxID=1035707 RepID=A0A1I7LW49_9BURK|nr:hypothetical protein [Pseudoduganella namucuonensis]SFV13926.1 hypothetical protein SAMN05216552_104044 [Pseudoduganella namucuonensis]
MGAVAGFGKPKAKREPVEVAEPKPLDKSLDQLLGVRKQRMDRYERERKDARQAWRAARDHFRGMKLAWREAVDGSKQFWAQARRDFMSMNTTSGQYQKSKAVYERMKQAAADERLRCMEALERCRARRAMFFTARARVLAANRQQEKLTIIRDEMRSLHQQEGA